MKRDMDLVRKIVFALEADQLLTFESYTSEQVGHHVWLMMQAGLVVGCDTPCMGDSHPMGMAQTLSWTGHEFAEAARSDTIWAKAKKQIKDKVGGVSIELLTNYLKHEGMKALGMA